MRGFCAPTFERMGQRAFEVLEARLALTAPTVTAVEVGSTAWDNTFVDYLKYQSLGQFGYAIPSGSSQQEALPWSNLDRIYLTFSEDVYIDANDLTITGVNVVQYQIADFLYDPQLRTARWTLHQPFNSDRILLDLDGDGFDPVRGLNDHFLDGDWQDSTSAFPSGDGSPGGDFEFLINSLAGDATRDGAVTYADYFCVYYARNKSTTSPGYNPMYDIEGSGDLNSLDYGLVLQRLGHSSIIGNPAGLSNDAPSTLGRSTSSMANNVIDEVFSLYDLFDDIEDEDGSLSFSLVSASNSNLFESISVNSTSGQLRLSTTLSGSGRSEILVRATDTSGLFVDHKMVVAVNHTNSPPVISDYTISLDVNGAYHLQASVLDADEETIGWIVEFSGVYVGRAMVTEDRKVLISVVLPPETEGWEYLSVEDAFHELGVGQSWVEQYS